MIPLWASYPRQLRLNSDGRLTVAYNNPIYLNSRISFSFVFEIWSSFAI